MDPNKDPNIDLVPVPPRQTPAGYPTPSYVPAPAAPKQQLGAQGPRVSLLDIWRIVRRRRGTIIIGGFLGLVIGLLVTLPQTPIYRASVSLEIQDINNDLTNLRSQSATNEMGTVSNALADVQTQIKILQSKSLIERAFNVNKKINLPVEVPTRIAAWRQIFGLAVPPPPSPKQRVGSALRPAPLARPASSRSPTIPPTPTRPPSSSTPSPTNSSSKISMPAGK